MQYRPYGKLGFDVSLLGMGCMRLPRIYDGSDRAQVDREKAYELIRYAADHGVNYFDTAFTYHNKDSEAVLGEALEGRRQSVKIATKQPVTVMNTKADIRRNLESTLKKLRTDYIDIYLIHNIQSGTWEEIKRKEVFDEYIRFREEGLIRGIGFSYHGALPTFRDALAYYPWDMCQVQQNLLDVDKEATAGAIRLAGKKGTALAIMEPLRGGGLVNPPPAVQAIYDESPVKRSATEWAFRHLIDYPEVSTILSGMTTLEQLKENIGIFSKEDAKPNCLSGEERAMIARVKKAYDNIISIPCTGCEYCMPCPQGVAIPAIFDRYNEAHMFGAFDQPRRAYMLLRINSKSADRCVECGACEKKCPQHIPIIQELWRARGELEGWVE